MAKEPIWLNDPIGLPVPPGFTISTEVCTYYYANKRTYPKVLQAQMEEGVRRMEKQPVKIWRQEQSSASVGSLWYP